MAFDYNRKWISDGLGDDFISKAEKIAEKMASTDKKDDPYRVSFTQFRNIYGEIKRIESIVSHSADSIKWVPSFVLLVPKMAYNIKRQAQGEEFYKMFKELHSVINSVVDVNTKKQYFKNFVDVFEGILAYYKFFGGK